MITGITIENFKGIRDRVKLDFRPFTLLFGANSAGKSTILHALHYAREIFERHNLDADQTIAGGKYIDLGGFEHFVNRRDPDDVLRAQKQLCLRLDMAVTVKDLPSFDANFDLMSEQLEMGFHSLLNEIESAAVELSIGWSTVENCPYVASTTLFLNGLELAQIVTPQNLGGFVVKFTEVVPEPNDADNIAEVSTLDHPCLKRVGATRRGDTQGTLFYHDSVLRTALSFCGEMLSPMVIASRSVVAGMHVPIWTAHWISISNRSHQQGTRNMTSVSPTGSTSLMSLFKLSAILCWGLVS